MKEKIILIGFFLLLPTTPENLIFLSYRVNKGQTITLNSSVPLNGTPRVDRLTWSLNGTAVAEMKRVDGSDGTFWRIWVADKKKYELTQNGGLIIKKVDKNDEGEYEASSVNVNTQSVHLLEYKVDASGIKDKCEQDGLKIECHLNFPVYPGRKVLVIICRISTKQEQNARSKNCDFDAVDGKLYVKVEVEPGYEFSVEFNDTANHTIKATSKIFLQFSFLSDSHNFYNNNPQMKLLIVKTKAATTTQRPQLKSAQQTTNDGTTEGPKNQDESTIVPVTQPQTSVSNTEEQVTTTTTHATYPTATTPVSCCTKSQSTTASGPNNVVVIISKDPLGTLKPTGYDYFEIISQSAFFWCMLTLAFCMGGVVATVITRSWSHCCKRRERSGEYELSNNNDLELNQLTMSMA